MDLGPLRGGPVVVTVVVPIANIHTVRHHRTKCKSTETCPPAQPKTTHPTESYLKPHAFIHVNKKGHDSQYKGHGGKGSRCTVVLASMRQHLSSLAETPSSFKRMLATLLHKPPPCAYSTPSRCLTSK